MIFLKGKLKNKRHSLLAEFFHQTNQLTKVNSNHKEAKVEMVEILHIFMIQNHQFKEERVHKKAENLHWKNLKAKNSMNKAHWNTELYKKEMTIINLTLSWNLPLKINYKTAMYKKTTHLYEWNHWHIKTNSSHHNLMRS